MKNILMDSLVLCAFIFIERREKGIRKGFFSQQFIFILKYCDIIECHASCKDGITYQNIRNLKIMSTKCKCRQVFVLFGCFVILCYPLLSNIHII